MSSHTQTTTVRPQSPVQIPGLRVKTRIQAGALSQNHNETVVTSPRPAAGLKVKTRIQAGGLSQNHNETVVTSPHPTSLKVKTYRKAGRIIIEP